MTTRAMLTARLEHLPADALCLLGADHIPEHATRAERRLGEILRAMAENGERLGRENANAQMSRDATSLNDLGLPRDRASRAMQLADVPEEQFVPRFAQGTGDRCRSAFKAKKACPATAWASWRREFDRQCARSETAARAGSLMIAADPHQRA